MRIQPTEGVTSASLGSIRPSSVVQLTQGAPEELRATNVALSNAVRGLANALTRELPVQMALRVYEILTEEDRMMLAWATDFASTQGLELGEVQKLIHDLFAYRIEELALDELELASNDVDASGPMAPSKQGTRLALPAFTPRDESLARTILSSLALRDTLVDRGFVHAVLDPERGVTHTVDFEFLRRIVVALSPAHSDAAVDASVSFGRREARATLALAVAQLDLSASDLTDALPAALQRGEPLLRLRLPRAVLTPARAAELSRSWRVLARGLIAELTRHDRAALTLLYVAAQARGTDLKAVDQVARALIALRTAERAEVDVRTSARERNDTASASPSAPRAANALRPSQSAPSAPSYGSADEALRDQHVRQARGDATEPESKGGVRDDPRSAAGRSRDQAVESEPAAGIQRDARELEESRFGGAVEYEPAAVIHRVARDLEASRLRESNPASEAHATRASEASRPATAAEGGPAIGLHDPPSASARERNDVQARADGLERNGMVEARASASERNDVEARVGVRERNDVDSPEAGSAPAPAILRNYGSVTQLAARASGTYRSLAGPAEAWFAGLPNASDRHLHELAGVASQRPMGVAGALGVAGAPVLPMAVRPLDLAQALGMSGLAGQLLAQSRVRRMRPARTRAGVRAIEGLREAAYEPESDAASPDGSPRRRQMRWQLLLRRRRRMRPRPR